MISVFLFRVYESNSRESAIALSKSLIEQITNNISYKAKDYEESILAQVRLTELFPSTLNNHELPASEKYKYFVSVVVQMSTSKSGINEMYAEDETTNSYYYSNKESMNVHYSQTDIYQYVNSNHQEIKDNWGTPLWVSFRNHPGIIYIIRAIYSDITTGYEGIIAVGIDESYFTNQFYSLSNSRNGKIVIYNNLGDIISCDKDILPLAEYLKKLKFNHIDSQDPVVNYDNEDYMVVVGGSTNDKWKALYVNTYKDLYKDADKIKYWIYLVCILCILIAMAIAVWISGNITANTRLLLKRIRQVGQGNFSIQIEPKSYDEVGQLAMEFNAMTNKLNDLFEKITVEQTEKQKAEYKALQAEFNALQAQINPHFLYNVLESVNSYARILGHEEIGNIAMSLARLFRAGISGNKSIIKLSEELEYVKSYLSIQKTLLGDRFEVEYEIDREVLNCEVPKLILQPIVENSIAHGIESMEEGGLIVISTLFDENKLVIRISDNGKGMTPDVLERMLDYSYENEDETGKHTRIGIRSVDKRIKILFGSAFGIDISSQPDMGTTVDVKIPFKNGDGGM